MSRSYLFSSESVSPGHPDKVADQVADAVLDAALGRDPSSHVACEVLLTRGMAILAGEFKTAFPIQDLRAETPALVASTLERIGYGDPRWGFAPSQFTLTAQFDAQSTEIDRGVTQAEGEIGAGDQGLMFGYATDETPERMPLAIVLARRLMAGHVEARRGDLPWLGPDAKSQVTVRYENGRPAAVAP